MRRGGGRHGLGRLAAFNSLFEMRWLNGETVDVYYVLVAFNSLFEMPGR